MEGRRILINQEQRECSVKASQETYVHVLTAHRCNVGWSAQGEGKQGPEEREEESRPTELPDS